MKVLVSVLLFLCWLSLCLASDNDIILKPSTNTSGDEICVIFIQGAGILPEQYVPLLSLVQLNNTNTIANKRKFIFFIIRV